MEDDPVKASAALLDYLSNFPGYPGYDERMIAADRLFYHGSDSEFDWPSMAAIEANSATKPLKVLLGLYVTTNREFAASCGKHLYKIVVRSNTKRADLPLSEMIHQYNEATELPRAEGVQKYLDIRAKYVSEGVGLVHIIEENRNQAMNESIIMDLDKIKLFSKVSK
jgi:hypothetical protein